MTAQPGFSREMVPRYGEAVRLSPGIRRVVARNPGPFTFTGTGTYIVGEGRVAVIDPGPALKDHMSALLAALQGESVSHILITHTHKDHSPAAAVLKEITGAPTCGFGPHGSGSERAAEEDVEAGADRAFVPDVRLGDGDGVEGPGWRLEALWTPGHCSNHLCFAFDQERALFTGDHVMGWSTTVVSPPDGDMGAYLESLEQLLQRKDAVLWPTHGAPVFRPRAFIAGLIAHRREREAAILGCIDDGLTRVPDMVGRIYANVPRGLHPAAARSVLAHLIYLVEAGAVMASSPAPTLDAEYRRISA